MNGRFWRTERTYRLFCSERYWTFVNVRDHQNENSCQFLRCYFVQMIVIHFYTLIQNETIENWRETSWCDVEIFIFHICEKYIFYFSTMSHYSKHSGSVRNMSLSERVHKLLFIERSLRTLQVSDRNGMMAYWCINVQNVTV